MIDEAVGLTAVFVVLANDYDFKHLFACFGMLCAFSHGPPAIRWIMRNRSSTRSATGGSSPPTSRSVRDASI